MGILSSVFYKEVENGIVLRTAKFANFQMRTLSNGSEFSNYVVNECDSTFKHFFKRSLKFGINHISTICEEADYDTGSDIYLLFDKYGFSVSLVFNGMEGVLIDIKNNGIIFKSSYMKGYVFGYITQSVKHNIEKALEVKLERRDS